MDTMRALPTASALLLFIINIIGLVLGPTTVGIISDVLQSSAQMSDVEALRYALIACNFVYIISFINYWMASKYLQRDLEKSQA